MAWRNRTTHYPRQVEPSLQQSKLISLQGEAWEEYGSHTPRIEMVKNWTGKRYLAGFSPQCHGSSQEESNPDQTNLWYQATKEIASG